MWGRSCGRPGQVSDGVSRQHSGNFARRPGLVCPGRAGARAVLSVGVALLALAQPGRLSAQDPPPPPALPPDSGNVRVLDPLEVDISATISATKQKMQGFERRRLNGRGVFITREQIERRGAVQLSDLLTNISGVTVRRNEYRDRVTILMGRGFAACEAVLFIDGSPRLLEINDYRPGQVEAMEIYTRVSMAPPGYRSGRCGSVIIWSRETLPQEHAQ